MSFFSFLRSRTFWTWYVFAGMVMAIGMQASWLHRLIALGPPDFGLPEDELPAATRMMLDSGSTHAWMCVGLAVVAVLVAAGVHRTRWPVETRRWAVLAVGGFAVVLTSMLFGHYVFAVHVLPAAKLASMSL